MVQIDLYLCNPYQAYASYPFLSIEAGFNADKNAQRGQGFNVQLITLKFYRQVCTLWKKHNIFCKLAVYRIGKKKSATTKMIHRYNTCKLLISVTSWSRIWSGEI